MSAPGLGRVGVWLSKLGVVPAEQARRAAAEIEELGYGALWIGETSTSKEAFTHAGILLAATQRLVVATGIASVWVRDATTTNAAACALGEAYPGRFVLGLGVSHRNLVDGRGHTYARPLAKMREYLDELDAAGFTGPQPDPPVARVLAALGPKMLELSAARTAGAHTYFMPLEHTRRARELLGDGPLLAPEQAFVLADDETDARSAARQHMEFYLGQPNYVNTLASLGFGADDVADGGSDRLVDALVAWGSADAVVGRVRDQLAAGADHVAVQPLGPDLDSAMEQLRALAPAVTGL